MKYNLYKRLYDLYGLLGLIFLPLLVWSIAESHFGSNGYYVSVRILFALFAVAFLVNKTLFQFLRSKFPALRPYAIRSLLIAAILFLSGPCEGEVGIFTMFLIVAIGILILIAKVGTIIGIMHADE